MNQTETTTELNDSSSWLASKLDASSKDSSSSPSLELCGQLRQLEDQVFEHCDHCAGLAYFLRPNGGHRAWSLDSLLAPGICDVEQSCFCLGFDCHFDFCDYHVGMRRIYLDHRGLECDAVGFFDAIRVVVGILTMRMLSGSYSDACALDVSKVNGRAIFPHLYVGGPVSRSAVAVIWIGW